MTEPVSISLGINLAAPRSVSGGDGGGDDGFRRQWVDGAVGGLSSRRLIEHD